MIEAHNITKLEGHSFEEAIYNDFGLKITNSEKITRGFASQVYKANLNEEIVFIRINKDPRIFQVELIGYKIFEKQGIPVPKVIAHKDNPTSIGYPTIIMSSAEGEKIEESGLSLKEQDIVYEKLGKLLKKINETKLEGFGVLKVEDQQLKGKYPTYKEYSESQKEKGEKILNFSIENNFITTEEAKKIKQVFEEISSLDLKESSLLHKDLHSEHFFVKGSDITGVIDLGALTAGDPRYDIAVSLFFQNPRQQEHFKKGYGNLTNDPMVNKYLIYICIAKIFFRSQREIRGNTSTITSILKEALEKL